MACCPCSLLLGLFIEIKVGFALEQGSHGGIGNYSNMSTYSYFLKVCFEEFVFVILSVGRINVRSTALETLPIRVSTFRSLSPWYT